MYEMSTCQWSCALSGWTNPVPFFDSDRFQRSSRGLLQDPVDGRRTDGDYVLVDHHEGQPPIPIERMAVVEVHDRLPLPILDPEVARHQRVVLVGLAVPVLPGEELAPSDF
jgi:hypothetical protein